MEGYLQMVSAEQKENAEVFDYRRIAEKSGIITDYWTDNLLDLILRKENLNKAYKRVKSNKGAGGTNGMLVDELLKKRGSLSNPHRVSGTEAVHLCRQYKG